MNPPDRIILFLIALIFSSGYATANPAILEDLRQNIRRDYADINHMQAEVLAGFLQDRKDIVIFDVREKAEYNVSHIPGSIRIDPGIGSNTFLKQHGERITGKQVLFYCSVGVRSSRLAARLAKDLKKLGATDVHNLDGGLFHWHNLNQTLVNQKGTVPFIHPYNNRWGKLVRTPQLLRTRPE
ncbi:MAG: rhodanese-like domain-containing protein [Methyloligellaceae bacterium]